MEQCEGLFENKDRIVSFKVYGRFSESSSSKLQIPTTSVQIPNYAFQGVEQE